MNKTGESVVLAQRLRGLDSVHLEALAGITRTFAASLDIEETLRTAVEESMLFLDAEAGSIFTLEPGAAELECRACAGPVDITGLRVPADAGIIGRAVRELRCQMVRDVAADPNFNEEVDADTGFRTRSLLCTPLVVKGECIGALELINKRDGGLFDDRDRYFLAGLSGAAALAIHNARMASALVEQERVRTELELARGIQHSMLSRRPSEAFPLHALNLPARGVSGDFYFFTPLADGRILFALGDVSGKGIHAALFMAKTVSLLRAFVRFEQRPAQLLATLNDALRETTSGGMFVTAAAGVLDPGSGGVRLANAGHEPPLLHRRDGSFVAFPAEAPPLGIVPGLSFEERELTLDGGALYLFSDGLTEGGIHTGDPLGGEGVRELLGRHRELAAPERLAALVAPLTGDGESLHDDITVLVVE